MFLSLVPRWSTARIAVFRGCGPEDGALAQYIDTVRTCVCIHIALCTLFPAYTAFVRIHAGLVCRLYWHPWISQHARTICRNEQGSRRQYRGQPKREVCQGGRMGKVLQTYCGILCPISAVSACMRVLRVLSLPKCLSLPPSSGQRRIAFLLFFICLPCLLACSSCLPVHDALFILSPFCVHTHTHVTICQQRAEGRGDMPGHEV